MITNQDQYNLAIQKLIKLQNQLSILIKSSRMLPAKNTAQKIAIQNEIDILQSQIKDYQCRHKDKCEL